MLLDNPGRLTVDTGKSRVHVWVSTGDSHRRSRHNILLLHLLLLVPGKQEKANRFWLVAQFSLLAWKRPLKATSARPDRQDRERTKAQEIRAQTLLLSLAPTVCLHVSPVFVLEERGVWYWPCVHIHPLCVSKAKDNFYVGPFEFVFIFS